MMSSIPLSPVNNLNNQRIYSKRPTRTRRPSYASASSFDSQRRRSSLSGHRLSITSHNSSDLSPGNDHRNRVVSGAGTLADELDSEDEDDDNEWNNDGEDDTENIVEQEDSSVYEANVNDFMGLKDSGIGVENKQSDPAPELQITMVSKEQDLKIDDESFSRELEIALKDIADLVNGDKFSPVDTTHRTVTALRELNNQQTLDTLVHRLNTSIKSISTHMVTHTKALQTASSTILGSVMSINTLDIITIEVLSDLYVNLNKALPFPDSSVLQQIHRLYRDTIDLQNTLSSLLDSIQLDKQMLVSATRCLKVVSSMVSELQREHILMENGRNYLDHEGWNEKIGQRWCALQCREVVNGFEKACDVIKGDFEKLIMA